MSMLLAKLNQLQDYLSYKEETLEQQLLTIELQESNTVPYLAGVVEVYRR